MSRLTQTQLAPRTRRYAPIVLAITMALTTPCASAQDLPTGFALKSGSVIAPITTSRAMTITQNSPGAIVEWNTFNIADAYKVVFAQPTAQSVILNRVVGTDESVIDGMLNANGRVFIVNSNGVVFGADAQVNVGGLVASTLAIDNAAFIKGVNSGQFVFGDGTLVQGVISNSGTITVPDFGTVALLGAEVSNSGNITASQGTIALAAGSGITLDVGGDGLTDVVIHTGAWIDGGVVADNSGTLAANGGQVLLQAASDSFSQSVPHASVGNSGLIRAQSLQSRHGKVFLTSSAPGNDDAIGLRGGTIDVNGTDAGVRGGSIVLDGTNISILTGCGASAVACLPTGSTLDASGASGGGNIRVDAGNVVEIDAASGLHADATVSGNGGQITVDGAGGGLYAFGDLSVHGGSQGGNGGSIETSGAGIDLRGISVDAGAPNGQVGSWMIDPYDVTIAHGNAAGNLPSSPFTPVMTSIIEDGAINNALNAGTSVTLTTGSSGPSTDGSVTFDARVLIDRNTGTTPLTFRIDANTYITNTAPLTIESTAGPLNVVFDTDANGNNPFNGYISLTGATILTNGGDISMYGQNDPVNGHAISDNFGGITLSGGSTLDTRIGQNDANPGGDILLRGRGDRYISGTTGFAVDLSGSQIHTSTGNITIYGDGSNIPDGEVGSGTRVNLTSVTSTSGNILITGLGVDRNTIIPAVGLDIEGATIRSGTGTIDLRGHRNALPAAAADNGLLVAATATIAGNGGPLWLTGSSTGGGGLSLEPGSVVNAGTGNVVLRAGNDGSADAITLDGAVSGSVVDLRPGEVDATGNLVERPADAIAIAATNGFSVDTGEIGNITANTLVIGSDAQTGTVTVNQALTYAGNVTLEGGDIAIDAPLNADTHTLALVGSRTVTQTAPLVAGSLLARGDSVQLANNGNTVSPNTLAGSASTGFTFVNSHTVGIGAVTATGYGTATNAPLTLAASGITAFGDVLVHALSGDMIINGNVSGTNVDLVSAGIFNNAGGDTVTATGAWRVWGNTWEGETRGGLAGSGTKPNLYGCTYGAGCTSGITVPATDNHFIYTQRPTLTVSLDSATREYGLPNTTTTYNVSGLILGDQQADTLTGVPSTAATQNSNVGTYPITGKFSSPVGYLVDLVPGTLAITPATLTYVADPVSRLLGAANGSLTGAISGFRHGDTLGNATTGIVQFNTTADISSPVGLYPITGSGLVAQNYVFVQSPANATALRVLPPGRMFMSALTRDLPTSYVYDRNFGSVALCPAIDLLRAGRTQNGDNLAREWSRVRSRPNLANCVSLKQENACGNF